MFQRWGFLLGEIWVLLALAALLGLFVGWLIWSRREDTSFNSREADGLRASLDACNAKGRDQAARIAALEGDLASATAATRAAASDAAAARAASEAGLATDRTAVFGSDAGTATAAAAVAAPLVSFGSGTADAVADTDFGQENNSGAAAVAEMLQDTTIGGADMHANVGGDHDVDGELLAEDVVHVDGDVNVEDSVTSSTGSMDEMLEDVMPQDTSDVDADASVNADADVDFDEEHDADDNDDLDDQTFAASSTGSVDGVAAGLMSSVDASSDSTTADNTDAAAKAKAANRAKKKAKAEAAVQAAKAQAEKGAAYANGEAPNTDDATGDDSMGTEVSAAVKPQGLEKARDGKADDLKLIKGVGPKLEALCHKLGFYHFDQIANWTAKEIAWVDENLEGFKGRVTREEWVQQARDLMNGLPPRAGGEN